MALNKTLVGQLDKAKAVGLRTVRMFGHGSGVDSSILQLTPGIYNETTFIGLDIAIAEAAQRGIRVVVSFMNKHAPPLYLCFIAFLFFLQFELTSSPALPQLTATQHTLPTHSNA